MQTDAQGGLDVRVEIPMMHGALFSLHGAAKV